MQRGAGVANHQIRENKPQMTRITQMTRGMIPRAARRLRSGPSSKHGSLPVPDGCWLSGVEQSRPTLPYLRENDGRGKNAVHREVQRIVKRSEWSLAGHVPGSCVWARR